jgi:hypothetical protein
MFMLTWSDDNGNYSACAESNTSAWLIYWALKKNYEEQEYGHDVRIRIFNGTNFCNPEKGGHLPACREEEQRDFLLVPAAWGNDVDMKHKAKDDRHGF